MAQTPFDNSQIGNEDFRNVRSRSHAELRIPHEDDLYEELHFENDEHRV